MDNPATPQNTMTTSSGMEFCHGQHREPNRAPSVSSHRFHLAKLCALCASSMSAVSKNVMFAGQFSRVISILAFVVSPLHAAAMRFDIPAQTVASAILAFSKQAGVDVLYTAPELKTLQSREVAGEFEPAAALGKILEGTGYTVTKQGPKKFPSPATRPSPAPSAARSLRRAAAVRSRMSSSPSTKPANARPSARAENSNFPACHPAPTRSARAARVSRV